MEALGRPARLETTLSWVLIVAWSSWLVLSEVAVARTALGFARGRALAMALLGFVLGCALSLVWYGLLAIGEAVAR